MSPWISRPTTTPACFGGVGELPDVLEEAASSSSAAWPPIAVFTIGIP